MTPVTGEFPDGHRTDTVCDQGASIESVGSSRPIGGTRGHVRRDADAAPSAAAAQGQKRQPALSRWFAPSSHSPTVGAPKAKGKVRSAQGK
eukprot:7050545-Lingulodinium_polyedra.AAC.1